VDTTGSNPHVNYEPNSTGGLEEAPEPGPPYEPEISGRLTRSTISRTNDYAQAGERYRTMPDDEREDLVFNLVDLLGQCERQIQERMVEHLARCDADYGRRVAEGIGVPVPEGAAV
jgi:catalase